MIVLGDLTDMTNEREIYEDSDEICIDCGQSIYLCECGDDYLDE